MVNSNYITFYRTTKLTLLAAVLFTLDKKGLMTCMPLSGSYLYVFVATVLIAGMVLVVGFRTDPSEYVTDAIWPVVTLRYFWPRSQ